MRFVSRQDAGRRLGEYLRFRGVSADLILGLPRGGVVVAAEIARELDRPLDVLVVRKIGHPIQREFAVGAMAEPELIFLEQEGRDVDPEALDAIIIEETGRLHDYSERFHLTGMPEVAGKSVLLIDDGFATGATAEAAALSVKHRHATRVIVAAPVASLDAMDRLRRVVDAVEVLAVDEAFESVGQYYDAFEQTTDGEVISLLREAVAKAA